MLTTLALLANYTNTIHYTIYSTHTTHGTICVLYRGQDAHLRCVRGSK